MTCNRNGIRLLSKDGGAGLVVASGRQARQNPLSIPQDLALFLGESAVLGGLHDVSELGQIDLDLARFPPASLASHDY